MSHHHQDEYHHPLGEMYEQERCLHHRMDDRLRGFLLRTYVNTEGFYRLSVESIPSADLDMQQLFNHCVGV